jgi:hypothetical protein
LSWQGNQGIALKRPKVAPQEIPQIDTARVKKNRFRMETRWRLDQIFNFFLI